MTRNLVQRAGDVASAPNLMYTLQSGASQGKLRKAHSAAQSICAVHAATLQKCDKGVSVSQPRDQLAQDRFLFRRDLLHRCILGVEDRLAKFAEGERAQVFLQRVCLLYTSPSPRD